MWLQANKYTLFNFSLSTYVLHKLCARVELFNGKGELIEGCIERIDRTGIDFVALEDPKFLLPQNTQWHVFAAFGKFLTICSGIGLVSVRIPLLMRRCSQITCIC